jgi:hypothetical protein
MKRHALDKLATKLVSRKLLAWLVATVLVGVGFIEPADWVAITGIWIGTEGAQNLVEAWRPQPRTLTRSIVEAIEPEDDPPHGDE